MFAIALNELWHFWFVEEITAIPQIGFQRQMAVLMSI
jgi:hypothetical protein